MNLFLFWTTLVFLFSFYHCQYFKSSKSSTDSSAATVAAAQAVANTNQTWTTNPACGGGNTIVSIGSQTVSQTLTSNISIHVFEVVFTDQASSFSARLTPNGWDVVLETINLTSCAVLDISDNAGNSMESLDIVKGNGFNLGLRVRSSNQQGSGSYTLQVQ